MKIIFEITQMNIKKSLVKFLTRDQTHRRDTKIRSRSCVNFPEENRFSKNGRRSSNALADD